MLQIERELGRIYGALQNYTDLLRDAEWQEFLLEGSKLYNYRREYRDLQRTACSLICYLQISAHVLLNKTEATIITNATLYRFPPTKKTKLNAAIDAYIMLNDFIEDYLHFVKRFFERLHIKF